MSSHALRLRVGPGPRGEWIVDDETGICGAICRNRDEALRFAKAECEASAGAEWRLVPTLDLAALFAPHQMFTASAADFNASVAAQRLRRMGGAPGAARPRLDQQYVGLGHTSKSAVHNIGRNLRGLSRG